MHEAIKSAINQKNIDFEYEILVMCDDPKSELKEACFYQDKKNIFFYRNRKNLGLYNSSNLGAAIARGRYIAFLHDDDILYPEYLSAINIFLENKRYKPKCILVNRDVSCTVSGLPKSAANKSIKYIKIIIFLPFFIVRRILRKSYKIITLREGLTYLLSNVYKAPSCGALFEKEVFMESGGFNQDFWPVSDYYYFLNFNKNHPVYMLRDKLACYRWLDNLSQNKAIQFSSFKRLYYFFKSTQPLRSINIYYRFFHTEVLYSKFLMINKEWRNEIIDEFPELKKINKLKWKVFRMYNIAFRFFHNII